MISVPINGLCLSFTSHHTFYHVLTAVVDCDVDWNCCSKQDSNCLHTLFNFVTLPYTVLTCLLLPCGIILACLRSPHTESFTLLNSTLNATTLLPLPISLPFSTNHLTDTSLTLAVVITCNLH